MVPKGVAMPRPPANGTPSALVWQVMQLPMAASCAPCSISADENDGGESSCAIEGRHTTPKAAITSTTARIKKTKPILPGCIPSTLPDYGGKRLDRQASSIQQAANVWAGSAHRA